MRQKNVMFFIRTKKEKRTERFAPHRLISMLSPIDFAVTSGNRNKTFYSKTACSN